MSLEVPFSSLASSLCLILNSNEVISGYLKLHICFMGFNENHYVLIVLDIFPLIGVATLLLAV